MPKLFCISGLGADEQIFTNIHIPGLELVYIKWIAPLPKESLKGYAARILAQISEPDPILLAVSFGGLLAFEISKLIPVTKIILISGFKSHKEKPWWLKLFKIFPLYKIIVPTDNPLFEPLQNYNLGAKTLNEKLIAKNYRKNVDRSFLKWAINVIINWNQAMDSKKLIHIHGTNDNLFPIKNLKVDYKIEGGTHMMVYNKSEEICLVIKECLNIHYQLVAQ